MVAVKHVHKWRNKNYHEIRRKKTIIQKKKKAKQLPPTLVEAEKKEEELCRDRKEGRRVVVVKYVHKWRNKTTTTRLEAKKQTIHCLKRYLEGRRMRNKATTTILEGKKANCLLPEALPERKKNSGSQTHSQIEKQEPLQDQKKRNPIIQNKKKVKQLPLILIEPAIN
ncbi:25901_t:CDS:2 [Dentiscutata erythropus]|uniref:25901_t:CDS:1 n=1 Tax=Dentiscutata erythropus TaxID=1348616 RepID=A0A9N9D3B5_9GLOM|nr:25901_t:CDS:2 [Dentiscutata erythropus]